MATDRFTKSELVDEIAGETGLTKVAVQKTLAQLQESIIAAVADGKAISLTGFVSFTPELRESRPWVNPSSGELTALPEKQIVKVTPLKAFKDRVSNES